mgnify:CR=1 FL=1|jgi:tRNA U34 5-methylaminomethyl-2-thiouridine-forming methyltransferase MnmC
MQRRIIQTADGSASLELPNKQETYHSRHGAVQESEHVFIGNGLKKLEGLAKLSILEIGWGTGLNSLLTLHHVVPTQNLAYSAIETDPLEWDQVIQLNYCTGQLGYLSEKFAQMHQLPWNEWQVIAPNFQFQKLPFSLQDVVLENGAFNLVYFDAFGPRTQPELWEPWVWEKMHAVMKDNGVLVTYCAKGQVRRDMQAAGFSVERLEGAPGKREMLRALKMNS